MKTKKQSILHIIFAGLSIFLFVSGSSAQTEKKHMNQSRTPVLTDSECPGKWEIFPKKLISGDTVRLEIRYQQGDTGLKPGASHNISLEAISVKSLFHCKISEDVEIVPFKGSLPKVKMEEIEYSGVGYRVMQLTFPSGLKPGESFALLFGNKDESGNIESIVNPFPFNLGLPVHTDFGDGIKYDWVDNGWFENIPKCEILAAPPSAIRLFAPTLVQTNQEFDLKISVTDAFDCRPEPFYNGQIIIEEDNNIQNLPVSLQMDDSDNCHLTINNLKIEKEGIYRIKAKLQGQDTFFESNPIIARTKVKESIYWGNIHNHGPYSECFGEDMNYFYEFARDVSGMDFVSMSDHIGVKPRSNTYTGRLYKWRTGAPITVLASWKNTIETANKYNNEKDFVTLLGYEWSSIDAGHYNIYMTDASLENMEKMFLTKPSNYGITIRKLLKKSDVLFIPHLHAGIFPWRTFEERILNSEGRLLTPVVEVYSDWGAAVEPFAGKNEPMNKFGGIRSNLAKGVLWAWGQGYKFGTISDADSHTGLPGRRVVGGIAPHHDHPAGITAVRTNDFSRQGITNTYHEMKTYGTTGERIFMEVSAMNKTMGETLEIDGSFNFNVAASGTDIIDNVKLYRGLELLDEFKGNGKKDIEISFSCEPPTEKEQAYVIQLTQKDENMAWSTPIWVVKKSVPELTWSIEKNQIILKNEGKKIASNIKVMYHKKEHPFTLEPIMGDEPEGHKEFGYVFSKVRDNQNVILHYRWHGEDLKGTITLHGVDEADFDYNRQFLFNKSYVKKKADNEYEMLLNKYRQPNTSVGFELAAKVNPHKPAYLKIDFEKEVYNSVSNRDLKGNSLIIPLNGRISDKKIDILTIEKLEPGEAKSFPLKKGYWSADPENKIVEKNESNNFKKVQ